MRNVLESAEQMPEAEYSFQADRYRPHVRDPGARRRQQLLLLRPIHERPPVPDGTLQKTATTKATIVKALGESVAYCDAVYAALTPSSAAEPVKAGNKQIPRVQPLFGNVSHTSNTTGIS